MFKSNGRCPNLALALLKLCNLLLSTPLPNVAVQQLGLWREADLANATRDNTTGAATLHGKVWVLPWPRAIAQVVAGQLHPLPAATTQGVRPQVADRVELRVQADANLGFASEQQPMGAIAGQPAGETWQGARIGGIGCQQLPRERGQVKAPHAAKGSLGVRLVVPAAITGHLRGVGAAVVGKGAGGGTHHLAALARRPWLVILRQLAPRVSLGAKHPHVVVDLKGHNGQREAAKHEHATVDRRCPGRVAAVLGPASTGQRAPAVGSVVVAPHGVEDTVMVVKATVQEEAVLAACKGRLGASRRRAGGRLGDQLLPLTLGDVKLPQVVGSKARLAAAGSEAAKQEVDVMVQLDHVAFVARQRTAVGACLSPWLHT